MAETHRIAEPIPMSIRSLIAGALATALFGATCLLPAQATAGQRYATPPPVTLSPDLDGAWTLQLKTPPRRARQKSRRSSRRKVRRTVRRARVATRRGSIRRTLRSRRATPPPRTTLAALPRRLGGLRTAAGGRFDPSLMPQVVAYDTRHKAGTIIVDTIERRLYHVMPGGMAKRYAIGVGKPGFEWAGSHKVSMKREWPGWTPPKEMIAREAKKGRILPKHMKGGPDNPLGARALYLGSTIYRIHGTNQDWSIGKAVSSRLHSDAKRGRDGPLRPGEGGREGARHLIEAAPHLI